MTKNGTTKGISGRRKNSRYAYERGGLEQLGGDSSEDGIKRQVNPAAANSSRENHPRESLSGGNPTHGKILQRLELVEKFHLEYVHAHQNRLEARLDESKGREEDFKEAVGQLKEEIYKLITEPTPDNGKGADPE
ncbi:hypothetical protein [Cylindrospermum sp. FACHB-282]|uniref:hypothetical protein n=1 Tax=Cylindrospermum sp. FACHB-282 TaxID=2692794 RepID=UPI0016880EF9|nr:hypothetical protein [Cylindrospermum sp. FACHB-282]MBD2388887.1 hypothetical protein [Cylindrospermum sp. FACHB-282]